MMADVTLWQNSKARAAFEAKGKAAVAALLPKLEGQTGVIALELESGDYFIGSTLGKANAAAFAKYPDKWVYFARLDNPEAAIALVAW
jgi:hypothetical protein